jgi:hypothetical protein
MRAGKIVALGFALLVWAAAASAYTVILKDGSKLVAKEKYKVVNGMALIVLANGTQTSIKANEIDVARTDQINQSNYGTAVVLDASGKETDLPASTPPPPRPELKDLIAARQQAPQPAAPAARRDSRPAASSAGGGTTAGSDLDHLPRTPLPRLELAAEIKQALRAKGIEDVLIYRGSRPDRALLEITTNSEAAVFRSLEAAAAVLATVQSKGIAAFELSLTSAARERAGQFALTPELASMLTDKRVETGTFYVNNVQF